MLCNLPKMRSISVTKACLLWIIVIAIAMVVIILNYLPLVKMPEYQSNVLMEPWRKFHGEKIVHIDLKGAPPKISYFRRVLPLFAKLGATGLLVEYEDMFPYTGIIKNISALNAYTMEDIKELNSIATANNLTVIPVVQTFGHMEFVLKLGENMDLREVASYPQSICPSNNRSITVLAEMLRQMIAAHPTSNTIHVGCDEVYQLGICNVCYNKMLANEWTKPELFLWHVKMIARLVHGLRPKMKILMWDDMFRGFDSELVWMSEINKYITPVVWKYTRTVLDDLGSSLWDKYHKVFPNMWIASAFKGASGSNAFITNNMQYIDNHISWMNIVRMYSNKITFEGIIITGWQRYDHFTVLCELLPVAIPSLAMSLQILAGFNWNDNYPYLIVPELLECFTPGSLLVEQPNNPECAYPGAKLLDQVLDLQRIQNSYKHLCLDSRLMGWMTEFNSKYSFSSPSQVEPIAEKLEILLGGLHQTEMIIENTLSDIYDNYTVDEWIEVNIRPLEASLNKLLAIKDRLLDKEEWPRRPINVK